VKYLLSFLMLAVTSTTFANIKLLDSSVKFSSLNWNIVNDTVMGGRSSSRWLSNSSSTSTFEGFLSLQNNGGFASVRHDLEKIDLTNTEGIYLKVKGDGRKYQFRIRSQASRWANYSQEFKTKGGKVQTFYLPYKDFKAGWRGRSITDLPVLTGKDIKGIGLFLGDKIEGKFKLEVTDIAATTQKSYSNMVKKNLINGTKTPVSNKQFDPMTIDPQEVKPD
jgi:NADH dehydrogenase [ubiquinone] 1 alpha subcomplex assembly factor 1